jgi:group II intron reverse transcriptase/maturase
MQTAERILQAMRQIGEKRNPLTRAYRSLYSQDLFLTAYGKIYRNAGALTPGTTKDTIDGMSLKRIQEVITQLRHERYQFQPIRRVYIDKANGKGKRPLGIPTFTDKLVQECVRMMLEAYYEPRFRNSSHGFRTGRGCHTALRQIKDRFVGTAWFIEGDIKGCFDNVDHEVLLSILSRDIQDGRLLNLIKMMLKAGVMEDWQYKNTYSGTPQGGILSPLLANIYLHELDVFIEDVLIPRYTRGKKRQDNPIYRDLTRQIQMAYQAEDHQLTKALMLKRRELPSYKTDDPDYRRLRYIRYADDFILGFAGPRSEAKEIKTAIAEFLHNTLKLDLSDEKTLITHARTQHAQFLGYAISIKHANSKFSLNVGKNRKVRSINGRVRLGIPYGLVDKRARRYMCRGKIVGEPTLLHHSDAHIINTYQTRFRGLAEYYKYVEDRGKLSKLRHVMEVALVKTLAEKLKLRVKQVYRKYHGSREMNGRLYKTLCVDVPTSNRIYTIYWGAISLRTVQLGIGTLEDDMPPERKLWRTDLVQRLQANHCELCDSTSNVEVHHVRKLARLKTRWAGRREKPAWVKRMIALNRKTLVVCHKCHVDIHAGRPTPNTRI